MRGKTNKRWLNSKERNGNEDDNIDSDGDEDVVLDRISETNTHTHT